MMVSCMEERGVTCNKALPKVGGRPSQSGLETKSGSHLGDKQCFIGGPSSKGRFKEG